MECIFVSYRQGDAKASAIALRDDLAGVFGNDRVLLDKDTQHVGNWREQIQRELERCNVVLVVIGPRWLTIADDKNRPRIQLADDGLRQEIAFVLSRTDVTVIPVLVHQTPIPRADQLPPDLRQLVDQQARSIRGTQAHHEADLAVLVEDIRSVGGIRPHAQSISQDQPGSGAAPARIGWLRLDLATIGIVFALMLVSGTFAYLSNSPLNVQELLFLFVVFYLLVLVVRRLSGRIRRARWRKT
jgi:TIR domain